jgi:succinate dehydrogenase hydrophobic anchor subunit
MNRFLAIPFTFVLLNLAAVVGLFHFIRGSNDIWFRYRRSPHNAR